MQETVPAFASALLPTIFSATAKFTNGDLNQTPLQPFHLLHFGEGRYPFEAN